jgi:hypothetical protein
VDNRFDAGEHWVYIQSFSIQLYNVCALSKIQISINRFKILSRFGIMHLLATNVHIWIQVIIIEIEELIKEGSHHDGNSSILDTFHDFHGRCCALL